MSQVNVLTEFKMPSHELTDEFIKELRDMLLHAERTIDPISLHARMLLDKVADLLFLLCDRGFTCQEISLFFCRFSVELPAETIKEYLHQAHARRLIACEQVLDDVRKPEWNLAIERTMVIEHGLQEALKSGHGLACHYQPQVESLTGDVLGAEALVRWKFKGDFINPAEFIPIAERSGLIKPLGEWVLREACREAKRWQSLGLGVKGGIKVSVNLSVKQFSESLPSMIHGALCDTGLPTHLLGLEITESFLIGNESWAMLHILRDSGIHLSMDDFGTGYSCLAQLKDLPMDTIKIDQAFVKDLGTSKNAAAMAGTIIGLAEKLGMQTLAEGVATKVQAEALRQMGCDVCQGFFYSKPIPGDEFVEFVKQIMFAD